MGKSSSITALCMVSAAGHTADGIDSACGGRLLAFASSPVSLSDHGRYTFIRHVQDIIAIMVPVCAHPDTHFTSLLHAVPQAPCGTCQALATFMFFNNKPRCMWMHQCAHHSRSCEPTCRSNTVRVGCPQRRCHCRHLRWGESLRSSRCVWSSKPRPSRSCILLFAITATLIAVKKCKPETEPQAQPPPPPLPLLSTIT